MHRRQLLLSLSKGIAATVACRYLPAGILLGETATNVFASESAPAQLPTGWGWASEGNIPRVSANPKLPVTVTDGTGAKVTITDISKIMVGGEDVADILAALGLTKNIYAAPTNSVAKAAVDAPVHFRYDQKTSTEGLLGLNGTLFIGNNLLRHGSVAAQFREAGVSAVVVDNELSIPDKIRAVASYVGAAQEGQQLAAQVQQQLDEARDKLKQQSSRKPRVLAVTSSGAGGRTSVYGSGTAAAGMIDDLGAIDVGVEMGLRGYSVLYSGEGLLKANPDVILMGKADFQKWKSLQGFYQIFPTLIDTNAGRNNRIIVMPDEELKVGGVGVGAGALALAQSSLFTAAAK